MYIYTTQYMKLCTFDNCSWKLMYPIASLSEAELLIAADTMDEMHMVKGDHIVKQDDIGDSFYVLEEGTVIVTVSILVQNKKGCVRIYFAPSYIYIYIFVQRKANPGNNEEIPRLLATLGRNSNFGEVSLITEEVRSATVTVSSDTAKCLRMTKENFSQILQHAQSLNDALRMRIGQEVVEKIPLFKSLTTANKKELLQCMTPVSFPKGSYICRQGNIGNTFYIITEGICGVSVNTGNGQEREVAQLHVGDFFGEVALIDPAAKRTANVVANVPCVCMTLNRLDFKSILKNLTVLLMEYQALRSAGSSNAKNQDPQLSKRALIKKNLERRRISTFGPDTRKDPVRAGNFIRRLTKYMEESLYINMYAKLYMAMVISPGNTALYGDTARAIINENKTRQSAVEALRAAVTGILELPFARRSNADHDLISALLRQRNQLKDKFCKDWPAYQLADLCKSVRIIREMPMKKIFEAGSRGTTAFLILRGCVRTFSQTIDPTNGKKIFTFEEDLCSGQIVGEDALGGLQQRFVSAFAVTQVDLLVLDYEGFVAAHHDRSMNQLTVDEKYAFITHVTIFKHWEAYQLFRMSHALTQVDFDKGSVIINKGDRSRGFYFLFNGRVDICGSANSKDAVVTMRKFDYLGESGLLNVYYKESTSTNFVEQFKYIAVTKVETLMLTEEQYNLFFDTNTMDQILQSHSMKAEWRFERKKQMKIEKKAVKAVKTDLFCKQAALLAYQNYTKEEQDVKQYGGPRPPSPSLSIPTANGLDNCDKLKQMQTITSLCASASVPDLPQLPKISSSESVDTTSDYTKNSLKSLEDIPSFVNKDYDPFLVLSVCKNEKETKRMCTSLAFMQLPPHARKRVNKLVGLRNMHNTPNSLGKMRYMLYTDSCSNHSVSTQRTFEQFGMKRQKELFLTGGGSTTLSGGFGFTNSTFTDEHDDASCELHETEENSNVDEDSLVSATGSKGFQDSVDGSSWGLVEHDIAIHKDIRVTGDSDDESIPSQSTVPQHVSKIGVTKKK